MKRRLRRGRGLTAEQLVDLATSLPGYRARPPSHMLDQWTAALRDHGYTPLDVFRARYWLRRGKPEGYRWDE